MLHGLRSIALIRTSVALAMAALLLSYPMLWRDRELPSGPPVVALASWLPGLPEPGGAIVWALMLAALALLIIGRAQRGSAVFVATAYAVMCVLDQTRLQPYHTFCVVILLIVTSPDLSSELARKAVRLVLGSVYFLAGFCKLNLLYAAVVHPAMMAGISERVPALLTPVVALPWLVPVTEMAVGVLVVFPGRWRWRPLVLALILAMHAFIVTMLLLNEHDMPVIAFNVALAISAFTALFDRAAPDVGIPVRTLLRTFGGKVAIAHAIVAPSLSIIGLADTSFAHAYYAGSEARMRWYATEAAIDRLLAADWPPRVQRARVIRPPEVPAGARPVRAGMYEVPLHYWFEHELGQGQLGEARIADALKDRLCAFAARAPGDVIVRFYGPADVTGKRRYRDVDCDGTLGFWLRFGGIATVVVGGDGEIFELEQGRPPRF